MKREPAGERSERVTCLCGSRRVRPWFPYGEYRIFRCLDCGLAFAWPVPTREDTEGLYRDKSFKPKTGRARRWKYYLLTRVIDHFRRVPGRWLDIGCSQAGIGQALNRGLKRPYLGIDLSLAPLEYAASLGVNVRPGSLESLEFPPESFAVAVLSHVLEHVPDPVSLLGEVHRVLKPRGLVYLAVPDLGHWRTLLVGESWKYFGPPGHIWYFNRRSLARLLRRCGFRVGMTWRTLFKTHLMVVAYKDGSSETRRA